jgi:hypothetical protein
VILDYQMNSLTTVDVLDQGVWRIVTRSQDNLFGAEIKLQVQVPALNIVKAEFEVLKDDLGLLPDISSASEKLEGVRIGPGMTKIIRGVIGDELGSPRLAEQILDAMEMLINAMTVPELRKATQMAGASGPFPGDGPVVILNDMVISGEHAMLMAENPRLKDSCVAFREDT